MRRDIVADGLNQIMNAKRIGKRKVKINHWSKLLLNVLDMMKKEGHIDYQISEKDDEEGKNIIVQILKLNECRSVKPRYHVSLKELEKYLRRFLPSRKFGTLVISTSKGVLNQQQAEENKIGGAVVAYFY